MTHHKDDDDAVLFDDDGGAAKGDERRLRRERRRWANVAVPLAGTALVLSLLNRSNVRRATKDERQRVRAGALVRHLMERSKGGGCLTALASDGGEAGGGHHWVDPRHLPPIPGKVENLLGETIDKEHRKKTAEMFRDKNFFESNFKVIRRGQPPMDWEEDADDVVDMPSRPNVDYTKHEYEYPELVYSPPGGGAYPPLEKLGDIMDRWPQDELDSPPSPFLERLILFDYSNAEQREAALAFRDAKLPFKVYNVPEVDEAGKKWTDEYVSKHFSNPHGGGMRSHRVDGIVATKGHAQESENNFFAFYNPQQWNIEAMGPPPTVDNDWTFEKWARHARWADRVGLSPSERHYYWQAGVPREERLEKKKKWGFVSLDLPSFSSPEPTFFGFKPSEQKGIQCRFGERGVTAATHYDAGRNMVAMITGAKRYILAPPKACSKLAIVANRKHPSFRHSMLNFAHLSKLSDNDATKSMPAAEREWLELARDSEAIDTVLKAGEVLYIPSHWFHYITSLQKSAQCNTRSGVDKEGTPEHGGQQDVLDCAGDED